MAILLDTPPKLHFDNTLGALFIGGTLASILYGITSLQTYIYFDRCKDGYTLRATVFLLWMIDTAHTALSAHAIYYYVVTNFLNPFQILLVSSTTMCIVCLTGLNDLIVRTVYLHRIWQLSGRKSWFVAIIMILSVFTFALNITFAVKGSIIGTWSGLSVISWMLNAGFSAMVAADVLTAGSLCVILWRRRTRFKRTKGIIRVLMLYTINTSALTCICSILVLSTYAAMQGTFIYITFYFAVSKLYLNSLLATLNVRERLREDGGSGLVSIPLSERSSQPSDPIKGGAMHANSVLAIHMSKNSMTNEQVNSMSGDAFSREDEAQSDVNQGTKLTFVDEL